MKKSIITLLIVTTVLSAMVSAAPIEPQRLTDSQLQHLELLESAATDTAELTECGNSGDDVAPWVALIAIILLIGAAAAASGGGA